MNFLTRDGRNQQTSDVDFFVRRIARLQKEHRIILSLSFSLCVYFAPICRAAGEEEHKRKSQQLPLIADIYIHTYTKWERRNRRKNPKSTAFRKFF